MQTLLSAGVIALALFLAIWRLLDLWRACAALIVASVVSFVALCGMAFAANAASETISIPWGAWAVDLWKVATNNLDPATALMGWLAFLVHRLGVPWVKNILINDAVERAIGAGVATVSNAVAGQKLDVHVANDVAHVALSYLVAREPLFAAWAGKGLSERIVARMANDGLTPEAPVSPPKV